MAAKLIIKYVIQHKTIHGNATTIEACGEFRDWAHFDTFTRLEKDRGWIIRSYHLEKEYLN